jgi:hypothetical protein
MRRRDFLASICSLAFYPSLASAEQSVPLLGFIGGRSRAASEDVVRALLSGLSEQGYVDGHNVRIEYRWANGNYRKMPALAADLVRSRCHHTHGAQNLFHTRLLILGQFRLLGPRDATVRGPHE